MIINISEIRNRKIRAIRKEFKNDRDYEVIALVRNNKEYNRAKVKQKTEKLKEEYVK